MTLAATLLSRVRNVLPFGRAPRNDVGRDNLDTGLTAVPVVTWGGGGNAMLPCPNCKARSPKPAVLRVDVRPLHRQAQSWTVVACPACDCRFYAEPQLEDYGQDEMLTRGRAELYLQQGAGLGQLCRPIARLRKPASSRTLDVGCGFGFGLDFARREKRWISQGIDPAQIAALGVARLGLPIALRLLGDDEPHLHGKCDVVVTAETIEHVPSPQAFVTTLKATLKPDGVLVLTTPDGMALRPDAPPGQLVALLSPGLHVVFQTEASLARLLHEAGFEHVHIEHDGCSLLAYASRSPIDLDDDHAAFRTAYRSYLEGRAGDVPDDRDLAIGFAGRALFEAANDGDFVQAARLRPIVMALCRRWYQLTPDRHITLPAGVVTAGLARLAELMPLNLAAILYAIAMCDLAAGVPRADLADLLDTAATAARELRRATGELAMEDAMSEDLGWVAASEALLCRAAAGQPDIATLLAALPSAPGSSGPERKQVLVDRVYVTLVNSGHLAVASDLSEQPATRPRDSTTDVRFARAMIDLRHANNPAGAAAGFAAVRVALGILPPPARDGLYWSALRGEVHATQTMAGNVTAAALCRSVAGMMGDAARDMPDDLVRMIRSE